jgi:hypothetical protein
MAALTRAANVLSASAALPAARRALSVVKRTRVAPALEPGAWSRPECPDFEPC